MIHWQFKKNYLIQNCRRFIGDSWEIAIFKDGWTATTKPCLNNLIDIDENVNFHMMITKDKKDIASKEKHLFPNNIYDNKDFLVINLQLWNCTLNCCKIIPGISIGYIFTLNSHMKYVARFEEYTQKDTYIINSTLDNHISIECLISNCIHIERN